MKSQQILQEDDIRALAHQARIGLDEELIRRYTRDLNAQLDMVSVLDALEPSIDRAGTQVRLSALREDIPNTTPNAPADFSVPTVMEGV